MASAISIDEISEPVTIEQHRICCTETKWVMAKHDSEYGCNDLDSILGFAVMMRLHIPFDDIAFLSSCIGTFEMAFQDEQQ